MSETPDIDGAVFREVLGNYPTGVTLVTAEDGGPCGMVIGSFGSVSLDPPLVQFMPTKDSATWERIERSGAYCVNVFCSDQLGMCNSFFDKSKDPFDAIDWRAGVTGSPIIEGALAYIDCEIDVAYDGGDHYIVVGRVVDMAVSRNDAGPLLFFRGGYGDYTPMAKD
jgi:3-hydroxy-9,10-secoandrosta-1,3,5(10)-triene-9,17-dione monooxygenase reductase component